MAEEHNKQTVQITNPRIVALGTGLPAGPSIQSYFQDETVVQVSCGYKHSAVVCDSGRVYTFGNNQGSRRMENTTNMVMKPSLVATLASIRVTQAACGSQYTMFLTDKGELYSCVSNTYGQLGLGHTNSSRIPVLVTGLPPIKKVAAGSLHTVALDEGNKVWVTGYNGYGNLGLDNRSKQTSFILVPNLSEPIIDISCGWFHTALLSASGVLLTSGYNDRGQLGLGAIKSICSFKPVCVPSSAVVAMSCGYYHIVALRTDGTVWCFGSNRYGQLGTGDTTSRSTPTEMIGLENHTITEVIAGWSHTALLTEEGHVLVCGRGSDGELGQGYENLLVATLLSKPPGLVVKQVAFAETYSMLLVVSKSNITATPQLPRGATFQGDQATGCVTNMERVILRSLECPVCYKIMSAPIHQCLNGHSLCNACRSHANITVCPLCKEGFSKGRNITLEGQVAEIELPCVECLRRMRACELEKHAEVCPSRQYTCPVQQSCGWRGRPDTMLSHTSSAHPDQTWRDLPHLFLHSTSDKLEHTDVLVIHKEVFILHRRYVMTTGEFQATVRCVGHPGNKDKFKFKFTVLSNNEKRTFLRNCCADVESVDDSFQSSNSVLLKRDSVHTFLQRGCLVCRATIITEESCNIVANEIQALFIA